MIDDRIEEGCSEEEAVADIGPVCDVAVQIIKEIPLAKIAKERIKPKRRLKAWEALLLVLGSPIWLSLLISAFAVILSLYVVLWSVMVIAMWSVFISVAVCAPGCVILGVIHSFSVGIFSGLAMIGVGIFCGGLAIFLFIGSKATAKSCLWLTGKTVFGIKNLILN